jgi:predicted PurR-regulated permease PerM
MPDDRDLRTAPQPKPELAGVPLPVDAISPSQRHALAVCALLSAAALAWLSRPVASGLFLGMLLAFSLLRAHAWCTARLRRPELSALLLAVASAHAIIGGLFALFYFIVARGTVAANRVVHAFDPGTPLRGAVDRLQSTIAASPIGPIDIAARVREGAAAAAARLTSWAALLAGLTFNGLLMVFFTIMSSYFVLRRWNDNIARAERMLPLHPAHTRIVLAEFQKVGGEVFVGTLLTGLAQGLLAGAGYTIIGAPEPALLGALTAICSLVPAVGTLLVWVPLGLVLALTGHVGQGIFVLIWGVTVVVILCDYVIRPRLVGGHSAMPALLTFVALFGGVEMFGLMGLIVGPVVASVALALLQTYDRSRTAEIAHDTAE